MHQSWKINSTIQTYTSYVQMTRLMTTIIIIIITTKKKGNNEMKSVTVCLKVQHTKMKKNANNAHKYDCSSPKKGKRKERTTTKEEDPKYQPEDVFIRPENIVVPSLTLPTKRYIILSDPPPPEYFHTTETNRKRKPDSSEKFDSKKTKKHKHDPTTIEQYIEIALKVNNFENTGIIIKNGIAVYEEEKFFAWVSDRKSECGYSIKQTSFFEKFDKSRLSNRVDPKKKHGPIKFLKLERNRLNDYPEKVKAQIEELEQIYACNGKLRFITHRDWDVLPKSLFVYEKDEK